MSGLLEFKQSFKGDIVTPDDDGYTQAIARWAANAERNARVVAFVKDTDDVALALKYARTNNLQVAIRCGGHSTSGASSAEDGLVIDLSRYLDYAVINPDKRTARVGGGSLWGTVENEAIKHGLATVAGRVNHVYYRGLWVRPVVGRIPAMTHEIQSLLLGGGYGFLTGQHGLVIDNLLQATIVTANGAALTVNESENADLFWAIHGGGSNFGVCTEFILRLHPQRRTVFAGTTTFPAAVLDDLMKVLIEWWETIKDHEGMLQVLGRDPAGNDCIKLFMFYNGSEEEGRKNFQKFYDLKPISDRVREIPFESLNTLSNKRFVHGSNYYHNSAFQSDPRPDIVKSVFERVCELNATPGNEIQHYYVFEYVPIRTVLTVSEDATAFLRNPHIVTGCTFNWARKSPSVEDAARRAGRELASIVAEGEAQVSGENNSGYGNFRNLADVLLDSDPPIQKTVNGVQVLDDSKSRVLFGPNYSRLQRLKAQYDPESVFSKWYPITPNADA